MSHHLLKDYDMALKIIEEFRKTQQVSGHFHVFPSLNFHFDQNVVKYVQGVNREVVGQVMQALYNKVSFLLVRVRVDKGLARKKRDVTLKASNGH